MTPSQHIKAALQKFDNGEISHIAPKPKGMTLHKWQKRLHSAAYNKGEAYRLSVFRYSADAVIIKPRVGK